MSDDEIWENIDEEDLERVIKETDDLLHDNNVSSSPDKPPLEAYRRGYLWVSDLPSQLWCEQQLVFRLTQPVEVTEAPHVTKGCDLHLARELEVQDRVDVAVTSDEDIFAIKASNLLDAIEGLTLRDPIRREVPVFGTWDGVFIMGVIDELRIDTQTEDIELVELKTRKSKHSPGRAQKNTHNLQVMLYKKLFDDVILNKISKEAIAIQFHLDPEKPLGADVRKHLGRKHIKTLSELLHQLLSSAQRLTLISRCFIDYVYQDDGKSMMIDEVNYDEGWLQANMQNLMDFWKGRRKCVGVDIEEAWKCSMCDYAEICTWRKQKMDECQNKNVLK